MNKKQIEKFDEEFNLKNRKRIDEGTKKGLFFTMGIVSNVIGILNYNQYPILSLIVIFLGIFLTVKSLS